MGQNFQEALGIYRELFLRYPSAYVRNFFIVLRGAAEVYEKLGMDEKANECKREMIAILSRMSSQSQAVD